MGPQLKRSAQYIGLAIACALSLAWLWITFEFRYMWGVGHTGFLTLRVGFAVGAIAWLALWALFPSKRAVGAVGHRDSLVPTAFP